MLENRPAEEEKHFLLCAGAPHKNNKEETQKIKKIFLVLGALEEKQQDKKTHLVCRLPGFRKTVCFSLTLKRENYTGCFIQLAIAFVKLRAEQLRMD